MVVAALVAPATLTVMLTDAARLLGLVAVMLVSLFIVKVGAETPSNKTSVVVLLLLENPLPVIVMTSPPKVPGAGVVRVMIGWTVPQVKKRLPVVPVKPVDDTELLVVGLMP